MVERPDRQGIDPAAFGVALDPFRPNDVTPPPGVASAPPICPSKICLSQKETMVYFLYVNNANAKGDVLLSCLNCGYETVYRIEKDVYEPRPGRPTEGWNPPYLGTAQLVQKVQAGEPTKVETLQTAKTEGASAEAKDLMSVKEAAVFSKKDVGTLYWAIKHGQLKATKSGRKTIVALEDLNAYLKEYPARG
jgi:excisionase family DNA binding protein